MNSSELRYELKAALNTAINHVNEKLGYGPEHAVRKDLLRKRARYQLALDTLNHTRLLVADPIGEPKEVDDAAA